jgi:cytidine deaminase
MNDITEQMERAFAELPDIRRGPYYSQLHERYDRGHFLRSMIPANVLVALHRAREAQELAVSYRGFKVGAAVVGISWDQAGFQIMPGINAKTNQDGPLNMHAEQLALRTARHTGADAISLITVVGETQDDQQSGHRMHTLHPCGLCRGILGDDPMVDPDATLVFSALPDLRTIEAGTINDLKAYHDTEHPDYSRITLFELPDMDLLKPFEAPADGVIRLEDTKKNIIEDRLWLSSIGRFLIEHQRRVQNPPGINP